MHAITRVVNDDEYHRIQACKKSKEACDVLEVTHEVTFEVKRSMLIRLNWDHELIQMEEDEMFENFYERFLDHINTSYDLIHPMDENK